jgi:two-component system chemotaxis response regulator CheB
MKKIHVLIVDDSSLMRQWLARILSSDPEMAQISTAQDAYEAGAILKKVRPDVITLDVEMPGMDGLTFLKEVMASRPVPVIMVSAYTRANCQTTIQALSLGAVDFIPKPKPGDKEERDTFPNRYIEKVKETARAKILPLTEPPSLSQRTPAAPPQPLKSHLSFPNLIGIGASTGGTQALHRLFSRLPTFLPPIVIVQHMPSPFTAAFAEHLDHLSPVSVREARDQDRLKMGEALVVPGDRHGRVAKDRSGYCLHLSQDPPVNHHRPSVDVLFYSLAEAAAEKGLGLLLTGMGEDGARGLLAMRNQGAHTLVQDQSSSTVFGMPQAAIKFGAAREIAPLDKIPSILMKLLGSD